jgi:hypothetical protein
MSEGNAFAGISYGNKIEAANVFDYRNNAMCSSWNRVLEKKFVNMNVVVSKNKGDYRIRGVLCDLFSTYSDPKYIKFWAANSPDYISSFSGSGLPYPNEEVAFENTPNKGVIKVVNNMFNFLIHYPNSYYQNMGSVLVPPCVKMILVDSNNMQLSQIYEVKLGDGIPFRTLDFSPMRNWNIGPLFYQNIPLVTTQEKIFENSGFPPRNQMPSNFWGFKPPM